MSHKSVTLPDVKPEPMKKPESLQSPSELPRSDGLNAVSTQAEAGLSNEADIFEEQARRAKPVDDDENLLGATTSVRPAMAGLTADKKNVNDD